MSFPVNLDPAVPAGSETPALGDDRIRALTQALIDLFGLPSATNITGALMSLGSFTDGKLATLPVVKGASPFQRFIGTEVGGKDVRVIQTGGVLEFQVNTGTEGAPTWVEVYRFDWGANFAGQFKHTNTATRVYTLPDRAITLAGLDDTALYPALTNNTGGTLAVGDVVGLSTVADTGVVLFDIQGVLAPFVVSLETPANGVNGKFTSHGRAIARVTGAVVRGHYLRKSTTTKALEDAGVAVNAGQLPPHGSVAVALESAAGPGATTVQVDLFGFTMPLPTIISKGDLITGDGVSSVDRLPLGADGRVLTADSAQLLGLRWGVPIWTAEFTSADQTITFNTALNVAHGLGTKPKLVQVTLKCATAEGGYSIGDELPILGSSTNVQNFQPDPTISFDTTNVSIITSTGLKIVHKTTFAAFTITAANWKYVVRAWA